MAARAAITPEQIEELAKGLSLSMTIDMASLLAGVSRRTVYHCLATGRRVRAAITAGKADPEQLREEEALNPRSTT